MNFIRSIEMMEYERSSKFENCEIQMPVCEIIDWYSANFRRFELIVFHSKTQFHSQMTIWRRFRL